MKISPLFQYNQILIQETCNGLSKSNVSISFISTHGMAPYSPPPPELTVFYTREISQRKKNTAIIHFLAKHTQGNSTLKPVRVQIYQLRLQQVPVMLNSMKKRDSNYCRETIRGLLSKTSCPSKLMDQQSTAVSFPIPFSFVSVLSNYLTLATQAGSVQLARSPTLMPFHWDYIGATFEREEIIFLLFGTQIALPTSKCPVV